MHDKAFHNIQVLYDFVHTRKPIPRMRASKSYERYNEKLRYSNYVLDLGTLAGATVVVDTCFHMNIFDVSIASIVLASGTALAVIGGLFRQRYKNRIKKLDISSDVTSYITKKENYGKLYSEIVSLEKTIESDLKNYSGSIDALNHKVHSYYMDHLKTWKGMNLETNRLLDLHNTASDFLSESSAVVKTLKDNRRYLERSAKSVEVEIVLSKKGMEIYETLKSFIYTKRPSLNDGKNPYEGSTY